MRGKFIFITAFIGISALCFSLAAFAGGPVKIYVNGRELESGVPARWGWKLNGTGKKI